MNILLSTDNNYVMPTGVLMHSISTNNGDVSYYILVDECFANSSRQSLTTIASGYGHKIFFYTITKEQTSALPFGRDDQPKHVSVATYYRLFISEILPADVHKIIYLDGDMIVRKDISSLWDTDLAGYALGVVHDNDEIRHVERLGYPKEEGYFNAGMLLINLDYWRENKCFISFMDYVGKNAGRIIMHDQDVLNAVFHDKKRFLPLTFNFQTSYVLKQSWYICQDRDVAEVELVKHDPIIIHFASNDKPWKITCYHPYTPVWRHYWKKSQWKKDKLLGEDPKNLKDRIRMFALRYCLYMPECQYQRCILRK